VKHDRRSVPRGEGDETRVDVGEGVRVMPGVGESYWNVSGVDRAVKIYNTGVLEGQLTLSRGYDWADTMANCEDAVGHFFPAGTTLVGRHPKREISSWSKGGTVLQRAGGGFNCSAT
jgi:hypothetical protein